MNAFAIFQQAQKNLVSNPNNQTDQFIVDLWNASKNLHVKTTRLQAEVDSLKEELAIVNRANADYARNQDMLESKALKANSDSIPFDASAFMQSMFVAAGVKQ